MLTRSKLKEMAKDAASSDLERSGKILKKFPSKRSRKQREQTKVAASPPLLDTSKSKKRKQVQVVAQADQDRSEPKQERVNSNVKSDQAKITRIMEGLPSKQSRKEREQTTKEKTSPHLLNPSASEKGKEVKKVAQSKQKWSEPKQEKVNTTVKSDQVEPPAMELMQINDPIDVEPLAVEPKQEDSLADTCQAIRSQMDKARSDLLEIDPGRKSALYHAIGSVEHARLVMARWRFELQKMLDEKTLKGPKESDAAGNGKCT